MRKTAVINVSGLSAGLLGPHTPRLQAWLARGHLARVRSPLPAVTASVQATYLTGVLPHRHGIVGNGWYGRDEGEIRFGRQSSRLVQSPCLWDTAREWEPDFTCASLFWSFNMYGTLDYAVTPNARDAADGRKIADIYTQPFSLYSGLRSALGSFPRQDFWRQRGSLRTTRWIGEAAQWMDDRYAPTLSLVHLPHLGRALQRLGPSHPRIGQELKTIDGLCGDLIDYYESHGAQVIVLSEYGVTDVDIPIYLNRALREHGLLAVREEHGRELLDAGASRAVAVADHQVAHVYLNDPGCAREVRSILESMPRIERILDERGKREAGLNHQRAGDFVAIAQPRAWFSYYYWFDDRRAPDFARTIDSARKPGSDPAELFVDPHLAFPWLKVGTRLAQQGLGLRYLMDVVPVDATLPRGSFGRPTDDPQLAPVFMTRWTELLSGPVIEATDVHDLILHHCLGLDIGTLRERPDRRSIA